MSAPPHQPAAPGAKPPTGQALPSRPPPPGHPPNRPRIPRKRPVDPMVPRKRTNITKQIGFRKQTDSTSMDRFPTQSLQELNRRRQMYGGWSEPPPPNVNYADYPVVTTKRELLENMRIHAMRLVKTKGTEESNVVDPTNRDEFTRPVTLHRRDPRQPPPGRAPPKEPTPEPAPVDDAEAERLAQLKAEKEAQRAIDQAKIAPSVKEQKQPKQKPKEEKISLNRMPTTTKGKKQSDIRYEEALPWHLEDADGQNVWVGSYESALSENYVALVIDGGKFRMIPIEKWYKFTSKPPFTPISAEQAEDMLRKQVPVTRWLMKKEEERAEGSKRLQEWRAASGPAKRREARDTRDYDEVDMDPGDEFQDDDETGGLFDFDDEDTKISNDRIRKNQLGANSFGEGDEKHVDQQEGELQREEDLRRKHGKKLKKKFLKRVNENAIESDSSDENPFSDSGSSEDSSEEEEEIEIKKEDIKKEEGEEEGDKTDKDTASPFKPQAEVLRKKNLKRAGSPGASESSGNESSRKSRIKKSSTILPQGQRRRIGPADHMSDGENTGGEMSDSQPRKKIKLVSKGTPSGSRAGSPVASGSAGSVPIVMVTPQEIIDALPPHPEGVTVLEFFKSFTDRVGNKPPLMPKSHWLRIVRENADYGPDKLLRRKQ